jgi:spermidine/putrescine-binding protein
MCVSLGGTKNEALMAALKAVVPSGNPNAIKDIEKAKALLETLKKLHA